MEQVINAKERNIAFAKFLVFFSLTMAIIVGAVYFDTLIPKKENELLRNKIGSMEDQENLQKQFISTMEEIKILNDSLTKLGSVPPLIDREIAERLNRLNKVPHQESPIYGTINKEVFNYIYEYTELNKNLLNLKKDQQEVEQLRNELNRTRSSLEEANRSLDVFRRSANLDLTSQ